MKVVFIGPGNVPGSATEPGSFVKEFGAFLAKNDFQIVFVPASGIHFEIAKAYKEHGGRKVIGVVPEDDAGYDIDVMSKYLKVADEVQKVPNENPSAKPSSKSVISSKRHERVDVGDIAICFGIPSDSLIDMAMLSYQSRFMGTNGPLIVLKSAIEPNILKPMESELSGMEYADNVEDLKARLLKYRKINNKSSAQSEGGQ